MIKYDFKTFMNVDGANDYNDKIHKIKTRLLKAEGPDSFIKLEKCIREKEVEKIKKVSKYIRNNCDVLLVIGVGGSYMGSKAIISLFKNQFKTDIEIIFAGYSLSSEYLANLLDYIKNKKVIVNVISKSGNTMEVNLIFSKILELMKKKYSEKELRKHIIITTNKKTGKLREIASKNNYMNFNIPNISGRYSIFTAVGLLPIAVSGIDIDKLIEGYKSGLNNIDKCFLYAVIRELLYKNGKKVEAFTIYDERFTYFNEWLKQLFAETQGKKRQGILPISVFNTRDMHSLGQYFSEGEEMIFSTVINVVNNKDVLINGKSLNKINNIATLNILKSYSMPSILINMDRLTEENIGELIYFFLASAAIGGYLMGVNPYNQPGVNEYKRLIKESI